jgi:hypothetical protein
MPMLSDKNKPKRDINQRTHSFVFVSVIDSVKWNIKVICKSLTNHELQFQGIFLMTKRMLLFYEPIVETSVFVQLQMFRPHSGWAWL